MHWTLAKMQNFWMLPSYVHHFLKCEIIGHFCLKFSPLFLASTFIFKVLWELTWCAYHWYNIEGAHKSDKLLKNFHYSMYVYSFHSTHKSIIYFLICFKVLITTLMKKDLWYVLLYFNFIITYLHFINLIAFMC